MNSRIRIAFLLLILAQGVHSIEEYFGRLWEVLPPARFLSGLVSEDHRTGFAIINIGLFIFGLWCWAYSIRKNNFFALSLVWSWVVIEMVNGIGHPLWVVYEKAYVPGLTTAPILLILAVYLSSQLLDLSQKESGKKNEH